MYPQNMSPDNQPDQPQSTPPYGSPPPYGSQPGYGSQPPYEAQPPYGSQPYGSQPAYGSQQPPYGSEPAYGSQPEYGSQQPYGEQPNYGAYGVQPPVEPSAPVNNNMAMSIVALIVFWPLGIPALINANKVKRSLAEGDYSGAQEAAASSRKWSKIAIGVAAGWWALVCLCVVIVFVLGNGLPGSGKPDDITLPTRTNTSPGVTQPSTNPSTPSVTDTYPWDDDFVAGDCIVKVKDVQYDDLETAACSTSHLGEVFAVYMLTGKTFPGDKKVEDQSDTGCKSRLKSYAKTAFQNSAFTYYYPSSDTWAKGDRVIVCVAEFTKARTGSIRK